MMKDFIPVAGEQTNGIEQQAYYAQLLIKAFQDALDKNNCLTKVPVAIGLEISSALDDLHDIKDIVAGIGGEARFARDGELNMYQTRAKGSAPERTIAIFGCTIDNVVSTIDGVDVYFIAEACF